MAETVKHLGLIRQARGRVLALEPLQLVLAFREQSTEAAELPHRQSREAEHTERDQGCKWQQPHDHGGCRPLRLPAEPPDDPPIAVDQRLHFAGAIEELGIELEILQPGSALEDKQKAWFHVGEIGRHSFHGLDRALQGLPMLRFVIIVGLARQHEAKHGENHDPGNHEDGDWTYEPQDCRRPPQLARRTFRIPPPRGANFPQPPAAETRGLFTKVHRNLRLLLTDTRTTWRTGLTQDGEEAVNAARSLSAAGRSDRYFSPNHRVAML